MTNQLIDAVDSMLDQARPDGDDGRESIDNKERGCGHLDPTSCYIRSDLAALGSPDGEVPPFVEFDDPVEYREHTGRGAIIPGYKAFPGNSFLKHYRADGRTVTPEGDVEDHFDRLDRHGFDGHHYADITSTRSIDVLMSVGVSNYDTPEEYVEECRTRGLNLKIPASKNQEPPIIEPLRTRVFVIHPHGCGDGRPGIIGYAYVTRNVFTTGTKASEEDPDVPKWAENYGKTRHDFDVVDRGEPVGEDEIPSEAQSTIENAEVVEPDATPPDPDPAHVQASDKDGRDVEEVEVPEDDTEAGGSTPEAPEDERIVEEVPKPEDDPDDDPDDDLVTDDVFDDVGYNDLKRLAADSEDVDVGTTPRRDELVDALRDAGVTEPPAPSTDD